VLFFAPWFGRNREVTKCVTCLPTFKGAIREAKGTEASLSPVKVEKKDNKF